MSRQKGAANVAKRLQIDMWNRPLHEIGNEAISALVRHNDPPNIYVRSGQLTRVIHDEQGRPVIGAIGKDILKTLLSPVAAFFDARGTEKFPPQAVITDVPSRGQWPQFPTLTGVVQIPIIRPDGTVRRDKGYEPATGLLYCPPSGLIVPQIAENPDAEAVRRAVALLDDVIADFPFDTPASRANLIGLIVTAVIRPAITGKVPCAIIGARQQGTGKTKAAGAVSLIATGRAAPNTVAPSDDNEWRKRITSTLLDGGNIILIDNFEGVLDSPILASALTAEMWSDRELGANRILSFPQHATWIVTGNNVRLGGDLGRRCYPIWLDAKTERPWTRTGFRHPNLEAWILEQRGQLIRGDIDDGAGLVCRRQAARREPGDR